MYMCNKLIKNNFLIVVYVYMVIKIYFLNYEYLFWSVEDSFFWGIIFFSWNKGKS